MKIFITGICGFVGSTIAKALREHDSSLEIFGMDSLIRSGSWINRETLQKKDIKVYVGDIRNTSDLESIPRADYLIDAAANPSVLAGVDGKTSSRQLIEHNLYGTVNLLEYCKKHLAGFILLSTSRVYSISNIINVKSEVKNNAFVPKGDQDFVEGISKAGINERYSTAPPVSLYGSTKVASEHIALEYGETFNFPVWINRCGVMAGAGQFGHPAQGIFAYWIHSYVENRPLKYIGFGGSGYQVRDCLHPNDLTVLLLKQLKEPANSSKPKVINVSGGIKSATSLYQLSVWCNKNIEKKPIENSNIERPFDIPWMVLDASLAQAIWKWEPMMQTKDILKEICHFAKTKSNWCHISAL